MLLAPAMNQQMWQQDSTRQNIQSLLDRGLHCIGPASGEQACGDIGPGRMEEPATIAAACAEQFASGALDGRRVVITAGPTREAIDPVRYISNHSSGKMGFALATAAAEAGARVTLIAGPCQQPTPDRVHRIDVVSAEQMLAASLEAATECDLFIGAAAVADYRPARVAGDKIKKDSATLSLELVKTPDIISAVAALPSGPRAIGFAAETRDLLAHASSKLQRKQLDMIIANDVADPAIGFNSDDNAVTVLWGDQQRSFGPHSKTQLARELVALLAEVFPG